MSEVSEVKDVVGAAQVALSQAMGYCAEKTRLGNAQAVIDCLRRGDGQVCGYWHYSIAKQVAESLGTLDQNVKAAYTYLYDATPEDVCFGEAAKALPVHLMVWTERKTAALNALVETWDRALALHYAEMIGGHQPSQLLDVQVVDSNEVEKRIGYGALLSSLHHAPIQVWQR